MLSFQGPTCTTHQVNTACLHSYARDGFHFNWECGLYHPCKFFAVTPPKSLVQSWKKDALALSTRSIILDFDSASHVEPVLPTFLHSCRAKAQAIPQLQVAAGAAAVAACIVLVTAMLCATPSHHGSYLSGTRYDILDSTDSTASKANSGSRRLHVVSSITSSKPFCGEYQEQSQRMNNRPVFKQLALVDGQVMYLLFNEAEKWVFTPHSDGRPECWAFVNHQALQPDLVSGAFSIWDGENWSEDTTMKLFEDKVVVATKDSETGSESDGVRKETRPFLSDKESSVNQVADPATDKFSFGLARALASMHVVAGHLYARQAIEASYIFSWGFTWVPWFFMLSGFILFSAEARHPRRESVLGYVARRSVSIFPMYALCLIVAALIAKANGSNGPASYVLVMEAWLMQAWVPQVTEKSLQMQCWFLSCLVLYWASFRPLYDFVSGLRIERVALVSAGICLLPWLTILAPLMLRQEPQWYTQHIFGHDDTFVDLCVVFLKFHPLSYLHIFVLGMLLGRLRLLLADHWLRTKFHWVMQILAPFGYFILLLIFTIPSIRPWAAKLSTRLSILLPLQSAILLGLAGIPGSPLPIVAVAVSRFNFLESYSYAVYVMQFICMDVWPWHQAGPCFFVFLTAVAVAAVHLVQKPAEKIWRLSPDLAFVGGPAVLMLLLLGCRLIPVPDRFPHLPRVLRHDLNMLDVRLPLTAAFGDGALINPSLLFTHDGRLLVAARQHSRSSERHFSFHNGEDAMVTQETWHSKIFMGEFRFPTSSWIRWMREGREPVIPAMMPWIGLETSAGRGWRHLCAREKWIPGNDTIVRLLVTGPEDPKMFLRHDSKGLEMLKVAFNSYPPVGKYGCPAATSVSQMFLADVGTLGPRSKVTGQPLLCGRTDRPEKNWIPFEFEGATHFVYSILPHIVMKSYDNGHCGVHYYSSFPPLVQFQAQWPGLAIRASGQAMFINDTKATPNLPRQHFLALLHIVDPKTHRYAHFAYRFSDTPPFEILQVSQQLPLLALQESPGVGLGFAFASSLAARGSEIIISYASGDREPRALLLTMRRLDQMFVDAPLSNASLASDEDDIEVADVDDDKGYQQGKDLEAKHNQYSPELMDLLDLEKQRQEEEQGEQKKRMRQRQHQQLQEDEFRQKKMAADAESLVNATDEACHTAMPGEQCHDTIVWSVGTGKTVQPEWYGSLTADSCLEQFQTFLRSQDLLGLPPRSDCPRPCKGCTKVVPRIVAPQFAE